MLRQLIEEGKQRGSQERKMRPSTCCLEFSALLSVQLDMQFHLVHDMKLCVNSVWPCRTNFLFDGKM